MCGLIGLAPGDPFADTCAEEMKSALDFACKKLCGMAVGEITKLVLKKLEPRCVKTAEESVAGYWSAAGKWIADGVEAATASNCEGYLYFDSLPTDWCLKLTSWAECGIADGVVYGEGYGCTFKRFNDGTHCKDLNSGNECNQFQLTMPEKSMMVAEIADNNVDIALGFFAVIGGCAIMYNAVQMVSKYACEQKWTPIEEADV